MSCMVWHPKKVSASIRTRTLTFPLVRGFFLEVSLMLLRNFNTIQHWGENKQTSKQTCTGATILLILLHRKMVVSVNFIKPKVLQRQRIFTWESVFWSINSNTRVMSSVETEYKLHYMWTVSKKIDGNEDEPMSLW